MITEHQRARIKMAERVVRDLDSKLKELYECFKAVACTDSYADEFKFVCEFFSDDMASLRTALAAKSSFSLNMASYAPSVAPSRHFAKYVGK